MINLSQKELEINFFATRDLIGEQQTITISQATYSRVPIHRTFPRRKISKRERHAAETLINNSFAKERVFLPFEWTICVK